MSGLISFLGGSAFRMIWGEMSSFITKRQEYKQEIELAKLQASIANDAHARNMEALKVQHSLGIEKIHVEQEAVESAGSIDAWVSTVKGINEKTGIKWIDGWNQSIRPGLATIAIISMVAEIFILGTITDFHKEIFGAVIGLFVADRTLSKRGK